MADRSTCDGDGPERDGTGSVQLVTRHQHGGPGLRCAPDELVDEVTTCRVESGVRLVEQPDLGSPSDEHGQRGAPALPGRETTGWDIGQPTVEVEAGQRCIDIDVASSAGTAPEPHVVGDRQVVVQAGLMSEKADVRAHGPWIGHQIDPDDDRLALHDRDEPGARAEQRGLPGPVRALEQHDLALPDLQVDSGERWEPTEHRDRIAEVDDARHDDSQTYGLPTTRDRSRSCYRASIRRA